MKPTEILIITVIIFSVSAPLVEAWGTGMCVDLAGLHIHRDMAYRVIDHPDISWALWWFGLDRDAVAYYAATEPQCYLGRHPSWTELRDEQQIDWGYPTEEIVGIILHVASDAGVGSNHCPACESFTNDWAEILYEGTAEVRATPALTDLFYGNYSLRMTTFRTSQLAITNSFKSWFNGTWRCRVFCDPWSWSREGELNGMRLGASALLLYFCHYADYLPGICDRL